MTERVGPLALRSRLVKQRARVGVTGWAFFVDTAFALVWLVIKDASYRNRAAPDRKRLDREKPVRSFTVAALIRCRHRDELY